MRLFDFKRAPNPRRVRIFLAEKGLDIPRVNVNLYRKEQLSDEFLTINPGGTVPLLETDDGQYLAEVTAICHYLESLHPEPRLFGASPMQQALTLMWNNIVEHQGIPAVAECLRNVSPGFRSHAVPGPYAHEQIPALVERGMRRTQEFFARIEQRLAETPYLAGAEFSVADIALIATVDFAGWVEFDARSAGPATADWIARVSARPSIDA